MALSRQAAGGKALVAGDMATLGRADLSYETMLEVYTEQAQALNAAGVDLFVVETLMGHEEAVAALEACRMTAEDKAVCCSFSVTADGMLYFGGNVYDAAEQVEGFGADAVGVNCSVGPISWRAWCVPSMNVSPCPFWPSPMPECPRLTRLETPTMP